MFKCGIYRIINKLNNKFYIGSSQNIEDRIKEHFLLLRKNKHHSKHLQKAFNKDGENNFIFEILEEVQDDLLLIREQYFLDTLKPFKKNGYNIAIAAGSPMKGRKTSKLAKQKLSQKLSGELNPACKLNKKVVSKIRKEYLINEIPQIILRKKYKINHLSSIIRNKSWIDLNYNPPSEDYIKQRTIKEHPTTKLTFELANKIRDEWNTNFYTMNFLSKKYNVSVSNISHIINNKVWIKNV